MQDLGFHCPGLPPTELIYRFRNPILREVIRQTFADSRELALRILNFLRAVFRPDTRTVATLYLRLTEHAKSAKDAEQMGKELTWWTALEETEELAETVRRELNDREVSPDLVWSVLEKSEDLWQPARRLALIEAYEQQPDGVPFDSLFPFFYRKAEILEDLGRFDESFDAAQSASGCSVPEPRWNSESRLLRK